MPVATSSRRNRSNRHRSSDIEEDNPTQQGKSDEVDEDEEEEEVQPRRSAKSVKKEKQTKKRRARNEEEDHDNEDDDGDRIDIDNFTNQPLGKVDEAKLRGMAADWANMRKLIGTNSFPMMKDVAISMADATEGDDEEKGLAELEIIMKDLIDIDEEMAAHQKTVDDLRQKLVQGEEIVDVAEHYDAGVKEKAQEYKNKTTRQKYVKSEHYLAFKQGIFEAHHQGEAMPPITDFIPKEDGDDSDDDDVEIGAVTQDYKCPLTLTILVDPMTSEVCGHSFSAIAIRDYLKGRKECPSAGCNKSFTMADIKPDKNLAKRVKLAARRSQKQEENSDAEVVE